MPGTALPLPDSGNATIHFAHANGFPASSYRTLFEALDDQWCLIAKEKFAHSSCFRPGPNWSLQAQELIEYVEQTGEAAQGVYAVGHSFGAVISYIAACQRPTLFRGLIMLDPPLVTDARRHAFRLLKNTKLIDKMTPAGKTASRRTQWPRGFDMESYFAGKPLFKHMDERCIRDYVAAATEENEHHIELTFDAQIEAELFRHVPHNLHQFSGRLQCPGILVTGTHTRVCTPAMRNVFLRNNPMPHQRLPGGHMFPLENPHAVARLINSVVSQWQERGLT